MVYVKPFDNEVIHSFQSICQYFNDKYPDIELFVDKWVVDELKKLVDQNNERNKEVIKKGYLPFVFENKDEKDRENIDFIITLGGDGTILWASKQFHQRYIPPLISFAHGSLGYLCNYMFDDFRDILDGIFSGSCKINLDERLRLKVSCPKNPERDIYRGNDMKPTLKMNLDGYHILNEVVADRGPSPYAIQLEIFFDGQFMTTLVGDGLIIATPTGSTAYNLSAGGSIIQANTQCISIAPLAPHSLSFRPLIVPVSTVVTLRKPIDNRSSAWISLDGATRFELKDGEEVVIEGSDSTLSMVVNQTNNMMMLWSKRLVHMLNWNQREVMKPLTKQLISDANNSNGSPEIN